MGPTSQDTVSLGTFTCPDCSFTHKVTMSVEQAREHASTMLAATTDGMLPVDGRRLGVRGGSDG
jgi:hypothetical protein